MSKKSLEKKIRDQKESFEKKQILNEEKRKMFDEIRDQLIIKKKENSLKKKEEIRRILQIHREKELEKIKEYFDKQEEKEQYKQFIESKMGKELEIKKKENIDRFSKVRNQRKLNSLEEWEKLNNFKEKINKQEERVNLYDSLR